MTTGRRVACIYPSSVTSNDKYYNNNVMTTENNYMNNLSDQTLYNNECSTFFDKASSVNNAHHVYQESESEVESALPVTLYAPRERYNAYKIRSSSEKHDITSNAKEVCNVERREEEHYSMSMPSNLPDDELSLPYSWTSKYEQETASMTRARWLQDNTFGPVVMSEVAESNELSHSHDYSYNNSNDQQSALSYSPTTINSSPTTTPTKKKTWKANKNVNVTGIEGANENKKHKTLNVNVKIHKRVNNTVETRRWAQNVWDYITHPVHQPSVTTNNAKVTELGITMKTKPLEQIDENRKQEEWHQERKICTAWPTSRKANDVTSTEHNNYKVEMNTNNSINESKTTFCNVNTKNNARHYKSSSLMSEYPYNYENSNNNFTESRQVKLNDHNEEFRKQKIQEERTNEMPEKHTAKYKQWYEICKNVTVQGNTTKHQLNSQQKTAMRNANSLHVSSFEVLSQSASPEHKSFALFSPSPPSSSTSSQHLRDNTSTVVGYIPRRRNCLIKRHVSYGLLDMNNTITMENANDVSNRCKEQNINKDEELHKNVENNNRNVNDDVANIGCANTMSSFDNNSVVKSCQFHNDNDCNNNAINVEVSHSASTRNSAQIENAKNQEEVHKGKKLTECRPLADKSVNTHRESQADYTNDNSSANNVTSSNTERNYWTRQPQNNNMPIHKDNEAIRAISPDRKTINTKKKKNLTDEISTITVKGRGRELRALFVNDDGDDDDDDHNRDEYSYYDSFYYTHR